MSWIWLYLLVKSRSNQWPIWGLGHAVTDFGDSVPTLLLIVFVVQFMVTTHNCYYNFKCLPHSSILLFFLSNSLFRSHEASGKAELMMKSFLLQYKIRSRKDIIGMKRSEQLRNCSALWKIRLWSLLRIGWKFEGRWKVGPNSGVCWNQAS